MSYSEPESFINTTLGKFALGAAALIGATFFWFIGNVAWNFFQTSQYDETSFEDQLGAMPEVAPLYQALKRHYPDEYADFRERIVEMTRNRVSQDEARMFTMRYMADFTARHARALPSAPTDQLLILRDKALAIVETYARESPRECARFIIQGVNPGFQPSRALLAVMADGGAAQIRAAAAGRDTPVERDPVTDADYEALGRGMLEAGASEQMMVALGSENYAMLSVEEQCALGTVLYGGLQRLPDEQAARLMAAILVESTQLQADALTAP